MTKLTLNFGMLLAAAIVAPAYAQDAPTLTPRLHFNLPAGPMENAQAASSSIKRMQAVEADAPADSRIPQVVPGKKTAPVKYACKLDSVVQTSSQGVPVQKDIFEFSEEGWPMHRMNQRWDASTSQWYDNKEYTYEYDAEGYPLKFIPSIIVVVDVAAPSPHTSMTATTC